MRFDTLLIANRGEIAVRVMRTARRLGLRTVAVYSDADEGSLHVQEADLAVRLGAAEASASYRNVEAVLEACRRTGAQAVHPGYGFLSENVAFAQAVADAGLVFVGPSARVIELMGNKAQAKVAMRDAGVPTAAGAQACRTDAAVLEAAGHVGYPLIFKAGDPGAAPDRSASARVLRAPDRGAGHAVRVAGPRGVQFLSGAGARRRAAPAVCAPIRWASATPRCCWI
jgi:acetyl/propionyl-CoA carboxylase alpha subunit